MHSAPAVSFPVGRSHFQGWLTAFLSACGVFSIVVWSFYAGAIGWRQWLAFGLCLTTSSMAWRHWQQTPVSQLSWDGVIWNWSVDASSVVVTPDVVFDFQYAVLLRLSGNADGCVMWVVLERSFSPLRWMALRRAIYGPVRRGDDPLAELKNSSNDALGSVK